MPKTGSLPSLRATIRDHCLADEAAIAKRLLEEADIGADARKRAQTEAAAFVRSARENAARSGLIDKFLQEYGLSTAEGVTLMRLAEALLRTPDAATADALIKDKVEAGDWAAHKGKSPFPLVNFSTRGLMLTAVWLDEVEAKNPAGKLVKATKSILDRVGEPVIRGAVAQAMRIMGEHFVLGETIEEATRRGGRYAELGYNFSYDMLGEAARTEADAQQYFRDYSSAIAAIGKNSTSDRAADNPGISVKLSALHPRYEYGKKERVLQELGARVRDLALAARNANMGFNIDAEEADRLDLSLDLIELLMRDPGLAGWDGFGVVVQSYQRRASFVLDWLAALSRECGKRIMVRLVKGAYWDAEIKRAQVMGLSSYPVYTRKVLTDISFAACARQLLSNTDAFYPQFATHNALTAAMVREMAGEYSDYELQRLHGMGESLHDNLLERGARSRIYAPVGGHRELLPYLVRRLLENGANSSFVNQLIDPDLAIEEVVADPVEEARDLRVYPNPAIPAPRDLFDGVRLSAEGWDPTDPDTAEKLLVAVAPLGGAPIKVGPIVNGDVHAYDAVKVFNPALKNEHIGDVASATPELLEKACESAARAASRWAATPAAERAAIIRKAGDLLESRALEFMHLATREAGKSIPDAIAEVREAVDFLRYYPNRGEELRAEPLGVVACISPWNFPLAIFLGQVTGALSAGNAVIAKPAEQTPLIASEAVELLHEAGVPVDVLHFLPGDGPTVGAPLVKHPVVNGVVFTGSTEVAQSINKTLAASGKTDAGLIAETGGINALIVDSTALLEQAVMDTITAAFQSAGQRCSACRLVCVQEDVADKFIEMLAGATAELKIGDPSLLDVDIGPVIDEEARAGIAAHIEEMEKTARVIARASEVAGDADGTFIRPVAFELANIRDLKREVFGPVLHVVRFAAEDLIAVVDEINALGYGLTLGAHTRIDETMNAIGAHARIGNVYVNRNQIGAVVGVQPFGGEGLSGTGPKAGGPHYVSALTKRSQPPGKNDIDITGAPLSGEEDRALSAAAKIYFDWNTADRGALLARAAETAAGGAKDMLSLAATLYADHFATTIELPGPTGESNTLREKGRGTVLCLGDGEAHARLTALALAAGNAVISGSPLARDAADALAAAGAPESIQLVAAGENAVGTPLLSDRRINAVAFDGSRQAREAVAAVLADRKGALTPLLTSADAPWRFAVERTLTINTTAAGGDVRLLSLAD